MENNVEKYIYYKREHILFYLAAGFLILGEFFLLENSILPFDLELIYTMSMSYLGFLLFSNKKDGVSYLYSFIITIAPFYLIVLYFDDYYYIEGKNVGLLINVIIFFIMLSVFKFKKVK